MNKTAYSHCSSLGFPDDFDLCLQAIHQNYDRNLCKEDKHDLGTQLCLKRERTRKMSRTLSVNSRTRTTSTLSSKGEYKRKAMKLKGGYLTKIKLSGYSSSNVKGYLFLLINKGVNRQNSHLSSKKMVRK